MRGSSVQIAARTLARYHGMMNPMWALLALAQVVAVLPFQDVAAPAHSKAKAVSPLAEGLRAVIAADLAAVPGLSVADRGARLRVTGAYQRTASEVKLWARFYRASGKLDGTATAEGRPEDLLQLAAGSSRGSSGA